MYKNNVVHGTLDVVLATNKVYEYLGWAQNNGSHGMVKKTLQ